MTQSGDTAPAAAPVTAPARSGGWYARTRDWLIASDPGLLRLQTAGRTTVTLAVSLAVLYLLTTATGEPLTVALLGVVIAMMSAMAVNEPDPRQQKITMGLLPVPAAAAVTLGALLAPHVVAGDVVFVAVIFAAVYVRRFGDRGTALGMVAFMTYFFALFLGATVGQLPWLIVAVFVGTACSFGMRTYVFPDRPDRVLRRTLRALWARIGAVVDATAEALQAGEFDERHRHLLHARIARLNQTALMVEKQLDDVVDEATHQAPVDDSLSLRLYDVELAAERLAAAGERAATCAADIPAATRAELLHALDLLRAALRDGAAAGVLERAEHRATQVSDSWSTAGDDRASVQVHRLALAITDLVTAANRTRAWVDQGDQGAASPTSALASERPPTQAPDRAEPETAPPDTADSARTAEEQPGSWPAQLSATTRQAIQVAVAGSLAIVAGELLSSSRWYWAVIAAFVTFSGTTSRGETLTKGWQRLIGTVAGVPAGVLVASAVGGHTAWSLALIFVCIFCGFYLIQVAYGLMIFWITTMLALLYGLLGQFSVGLLVLRIEETAIGAAIGVLVAILVLPTSTRTTISGGARTFLATLGDLVEAAAPTLLAATENLTEQARELDQQLQQVRTSAKPRTRGIAGIAGRGSARHGLRVFTACDHYARTLARSAGRPHPALADPALAGLVTAAAEHTRRNIEALAAVLDHRNQASVRPATGLLDTADQALEGLIGDGRSPDTENRRLRTALHSLRHIDQAVVGLAQDLGAAETSEHDIRIAQPA